MAVFNFERTFKQLINTCIYLHTIFPKKAIRSDNNTIKPECNVPEMYEHNGTCICTNRWLETSCNDNAHSSGSMEGGVGDNGPPWSCKNQ